MKTRFLPILMLGALGLLFCSTLSATPPSVTVINAGVPGNNSGNLLPRIEKSVLQKRPALVIVAVGTNDALNSKNAVPLVKFQQNLGEILEQIRGGGARAILLTPPPCHDPYVLLRHSPSFFEGESPSAKVERVRQVLLELGRKADVPVVDIHALFEKSGSIGELEESWLQNERNSGAKDGVHPTAIGYRAIGEAVAREVRKMALPAGAVVVCFGDSITFGSGAKGAGTTKGESYPAVLQHVLGHTEL